MKMTLFLITLCLGLNNLLAQTIYTQETHDKISEIEHNITGRLLLNKDQPSTILERMKKYKVKGMSIAVIHDYKIAWAKAYGWANEEQKKPMTTETLFEPGSISKSLNALGILKLAQEKKVDLNTDINEYLISWKFPYDSLSKGKKITLAHILSHNAGLTVHGFPGHDIQGPIPTVLEVLDGKKPSFTPAVRSAYEPGLQFEYSGGGTTISQVLLTDVTNQTYDQWMYENVLKPIGMEHSFYSQPPPKEKQPLCASGYNGDGTPISNKFHVYPEQAAAGLWMTPSDLCQYIIDMQLAYEGKPSKVLSPEMVKLHLTSYNDGPTSLGSFIVDINGEKYFEHGARNDGFCGDFYGSLERGNGVVIFLNSDDGTLISEFINSVAKAYQWKNFYHEPLRKKSIKVADKLLKSYEGLYLYDQTWSAIGKKDNKYHFYTNGSYVNMYFSTPTCFFNEEFPAVKTFIKDNNGNVVGYSRTVDGKEFPNAKKITNLDSIHLESNAIGEMAWYMFEQKNYNQAISCYKRGLKLYPQDLNLFMNLAHTYVFSGDQKSAIAIYKAHQKDVIRPGYTWEDSMKDDLIYFKDHHYEVKSFKKIFAVLKIDLPKGI